MPKRSPSKVTRADVGRLRQKLNTLDAHAHEAKSPIARELLSRRRQRLLDHLKPARAA